MPYAVAIGREEVELLQGREITGIKLQGSIMEYDVRNGLKTTSEIAELPDCPARWRLVNRCATLYGRHLADVRKRESANASKQESLTSWSDDKPLEEVTEDSETEQVAKPARKRSGSVTPRATLPQA